jgi:hypothetical protein
MIDAWVCEYYEKTIEDSNIAKNTHCIQIQMLLYLALTNMQ